MRFSHLVSSLALIMGLVTSCKVNTPGLTILDDGSSGGSISTTYYPYDAADARNMGPGHFSCSQFNSETQWYVAPSDTFGDEQLWKGPACPPNPYGGPPDCAKIMTTCGHKVKISCATNCKPGAPAVVALITDVCPKNHPQNIGKACQGGPHFDIGKPIWELMHKDNDNIQVRYQNVSQDTPLGPTNGSSGAQQSTPAPSSAQSNSQSSPQSSPQSSAPSANPISNQANSPSSKPVGTSTISGTPAAAPSSAPGTAAPKSQPATPSAPASAPAPSTPAASDQGKWCDPYKSGSCFPYCTNDSNTGNNFGWQPELGGPNGGSCRVR